MTVHELPLFVLLMTVPKLPAANTKLPSIVWTARRINPDIEDTSEVATEVQKLKLDPLVDLKTVPLEPTTKTLPLVPKDTANRSLEEMLA